MFLTIATRHPNSFPALKLLIIISFVAYSLTILHISCMLFIRTSSGIETEEPFSAIYSCYYVNNIVIL